MPIRFTTADPGFDDAFRLFLAAKREASPEVDAVVADIIAQVQRAGDSAQGVELGSRWTAVESVGLYVPGGLASYPSSVLMNAVPAKVAGVERIAMVVPSPGGELNPLVLTAARLAGV